VSEELLPLFRLGPELMHAHRARALFEAGFKTHEDLAVVSGGSLHLVLCCVFLLGLRCVSRLSGFRAGACMCGTRGALT
jgi:hypothetical protein